MGYAKYTVVIGTASILSSCGTITKEIVKSGYDKEILVLFGIIAIGTIYWFWVKPWIEERSSEKTQSRVESIETTKKSANYKPLSSSSGVVDWKRINKLVEASTDNPENIFKSSINPSITELEIALQIGYENSLKRLADTAGVFRALNKWIEYREKTKKNAKNQDGKDQYHLDKEDIEKVANDMMRYVFPQIANDSMHTFLPLIFSPDLKTTDSIFIKDAELQK